MHVHEGEVGAKKEWSGIRSGRDKSGDMGAQLGREIDLVLRVLGLEVAVEGWDDVAIDVIGPEAAMSS